MNCSRWSTSTPSNLSCVFLFVPPPVLLRRRPEWELGGDGGEVVLSHRRRLHFRLRLLGGIEGVRRILRRRGAFLESVESDRDATTKYRFLAQGARDGRWIHKLSSGG